MLDRGVDSANMEAELEFSHKRESGNNKDPYTVAVIQRGTIVGYVPRKISAACSLFLHSTIHCTISRARRQGSFEVPCKLMFKGQPNDVAKVRKLLTADAV